MYCFMFIIVGNLRDKIKERLESCKIKVNLNPTKFITIEVRKLVHLYAVPLVSKVLNVHTLL